jgi:hypothetical protein
MTERVEPLDLGVEWDPNNPSAVFMSDDAGHGLLALRPHLRDTDQRSVVLQWEGVLYAQVGGPNDEALHEHPLHAKGLADLMWAGVVTESALAASLRGMWSETVWSAEGFVPRQVVHFVILTKEELVEVLASKVEVTRKEGSTRQAAAALLELTVPE